MLWMEYVLVDGAAFDADDDEAATPFHTSHIAKLILNA